MRRIIHAVQGWIRGRTSPAGRRPAFVYVYPAGKETQNGELGTNDQIAVLRRLSTFVSKEDAPVTVIFPGRPSRKIPDGTTQSGVQVRYATGDQLRKVAFSAVTEAKRHHSPILATNHPELEKTARHDRIRHIRASTLEEALDMVCGPLRREQPPQQQQQRRQPQPQPAQQQAPPAQAAKASPQEQETPPAPPAEPASPDAADTGNQAPVARPEPKPDTSPRRLQRNEPTSRNDIKDQSILDLIDPL